MDTARGTIATTPGDAADVSPSIRLASGTSISIRGGWVTCGHTAPVARVADASFFADRLSSICSTADAATCVAGGSSRVIINVDVTAVVDRSRVTEDACPVPATGCPPWTGLSSLAVSERAAP
jgi:hypothetical protein